MDESKKDLSKEGSLPSGGISRRSFLKGAGLTSLGLALASGGPLTSSVEGKGTSRKVLGPGSFPIHLQVNGKKYQVQVEPQHTLAEVLREKLHLTGTKIACNRGACGSCTVILGNKTVPSCMTLAIDGQNLPIQTIEGLGGEELHPLQQSFIDHDGFQCGFCTSGMIMSCKNLLDHNPKPSLEETKEAVRGNLCRCGAYPNIFESVMALSKKKKE